MPDGYKDQYFLEKTKLSFVFDLLFRTSGKETNIKVNYHPPKAGVYYIVSAVSFFILSLSCRCDYHISPMIMDGSLVVENMYGHLPAPQYGSLPFYSYMCLVYVISLVVWIRYCIQFKNEIMSVQIIILVRISF